MALFRRNRQQNSVLPDEVNQYYQSQRREKTGVVFVLGILALVATLLVGLGVFFGGRYLYQKIRGNDTPKTPGATVQIDTNANKVELPQIEGNGAPDQGDQEVAPSPSNGNVQAPENSTTPQQTPALGDEPTILPATGDEGH